MGNMPQLGNIAPDKAVVTHPALVRAVIRASREEIVAELEYKIPPMVRTGGCVLSLDHRIPNGTPLANYRFYVETMWRLLERESGSPDGG